MDETDKIARGEQARNILHSSILTDSFDRLERGYVAAWKKALTVEAREDAHRYVTLIGWLKQDLQSMVTTGELTKQRLAALEGAKPSIWKR